MGNDSFYCGFCHGKNNLCITSENFSSYIDMNTNSRAQKLWRKRKYDDTIISNISIDDTPQSAEALSICQLPDTVLLHIFSFLPVKQLYKIRYVSKRWLCISEDNLLWQSLNISCQNVNDEFIKEIVILPKHLLQKIKIVNLMWSYVTSSAFQILCENINQQTILLLRHSRLLGIEILQNDENKRSHTNKIEIADFRFTQGRWSGLLRHCLSLSNLKCLAISDNVSVGYIGYLAKSTQMGNLKVLNVSGNTSITDDLMMSLIEHAPNIESLSVHSCMSIQGKYLAYLVKLPKLKLLDINSSRYVTSNLTDIAWDKLKLESLDISFCCPLSEEILAAMVKYICTIKKLNVSFVGWGRSFSDDVISQIVQANGNLLSLESLDMHSTFNVTLTGLELLLSVCPKLLHLRIGSLIRSATELEVICKRLPNIENFSLQLANAFFDAAILFEIFSKYCQKLQTIFVFNLRFEFSEEFETSFGLFLEKCLDIKNIFVGSYPFSEKQNIDCLMKKVAKKYERNINTVKPSPAIPAHELSFDAFLFNNFKARNYHSEELKHSLKRNLNCQSFYLTGLTLASNRRYYQ